MKTVNYPLEVAVQNVTYQNKEALVERYKAVLESNKDFMRKCDYICYSISSINTRVKAIDEELEHLIGLKTTLQDAQQIALEAGVEAFDYYGISKLEGSVFKSITVSKPIESNKKRLVVLDEQSLIENGFYKTIKVLDKQKLLDEYADGTYIDFIKQHTRLESVFEKKRASLIINRRENNQASQTDHRYLKTS